VSWLDDWSPWRLRKQVVSASSLLKLERVCAMAGAEIDRLRKDIATADACKDAARKERDDFRIRLESLQAEGIFLREKERKAAPCGDAALADLRKLRTPIFVAKSDAMALVEKLQALHEASCFESGVLMRGWPDDGPDHCGPQGTMESDQ
jgi:hypothetical protein